ncbi:MAG: hypothetical protein PHR71_05630, partial [Polaromonas sp.]|nr:hypothetical protein [Polaromonas sp.]
RDFREMLNGMPSLPAANVRARQELSVKGDEDRMAALAKCFNWFRLHTGHRVPSDSGMSAAPCLPADQEIPDASFVRSRLDCQRTVRRNMR